MHRKENIDLTIVSEARNEYAYVVSALQSSFQPDLLVSVSTLVTVYKLSLLGLKVNMTHFKKTEAKQSKNK